MNGIHPANAQKPSLVSHSLLKGFDVSWAGAHPFGDGFCFGLEDGRLLFTDVEGKLLFEPMAGSPSGEVITGVAGIGRWLAVTSRSEVTLWTLPEREGEKTYYADFPHGAHDITVTGGGHFVGALGRTGLLVLQPSTEPTHTMKVCSVPETEGLYFYRMASFPTDRGQALVACAARQGGVAVTKFQWEMASNYVSTLVIDGLDIVDVCSLNVDSNPLAAAAVSRDGSLILFQNVWADKHALILNYGPIEGIAYRLMSSQGHLFLLTSKGIYVFVDLAVKFGRGEPIGHSATPTLVIPLEAVDANLCGDRWLLVVMPDEVRRFDINWINQNKPANLSNGALRDFTPQVVSSVVKRREVEPTLSLRAVA